MINKKGALVLRDIVFMMLIMSSVIVFAGLFVSEMAVNYENTNMSNEWALKGTNTIAISMLNDTHNDMEEAGSKLGFGVWDLVIGGLKSIGNIIAMIITAPNTIGLLVAGTLVDANISTTATNWISGLVSGILWAIILFTIYSSFLKGGKL